MGSIRRVLVALVLGAGLAAAAPGGTLTPTPSPTPTALPASARADEIAALRRDLRQLRQRLQAQGQAEAGRRERRWWDLPSRRGQERRLRRLQHWRQQLEDLQFRLMQLEGEAEKPLQDKDE
jgi:TolA-binding protein